MSNEQKVNAWEVEKEDEPFFCPLCKRNVILKKGLIRVPHFSHKPPIDCRYGSEESETHYLVKKQIYEYLKNSPISSNVELEKMYAHVRPDVFFSAKGKHIAIEVQNSKIEIYEIYRHMREYNNLGICVLWVIPKAYPEMIYDEEVKGYITKIKEWESYLHTLYYGRIYYIGSDSLLNAIHFKKFERQTDSAEWYENGELQSVGGYSRIPKTLREVVFQDKKYRIDIDLFSSFRKTDEHFGNYDYPKCLLWKEGDRWW
jgi:competence protein CoiA